MNDYEQSGERRMDVLYSALPIMIQGVFLYASTGIKAFILLCGGSAAALLAFIGHLVNVGNVPAAHTMGLPLCCFLGAAVLACGVLCLSYLSQSCFVQDAQYELLEIPNTSSCRWGIFFQCLAVLAMLAAFVACFAGMWLAYGAFMSL